MVSLTSIPHQDVDAAIENAKDQMQPLREYNTNFHSHAEISEALPDIEDCSPEEQPWILIGPWLDLINSSRGLKDKELHRVALPGGFLVLLEEANKSALITGRLSNEEQVDLADYFPGETMDGLDINEVIRTQQLFVRLDTCSLKDARSGKGPPRDVNDVITRMATSSRGMAGIRDLRNASMPVVVYFFPWDKTIETELEYRVFCPPAISFSTATKKSPDRVVAISQYRWHEPWFHHKKPRSEQVAIAERLVEHCQDLYEEIKAHPALTPSIRSRGFVFDVVEDSVTQKVRLIELNDFGAQSGCGACLYHWIRDARILYGRENDVDVRVST